MTPDPTPLRFSHLHLRNWRNFSEVDVDLPGRVFLVGPNASGKSNVLDVFRFLRDIADGKLEQAIDSRGGVPRIRSLSAHGNFTVEIDITIGTEQAPRLWRYVLHFFQARNGEPRIRKEQVFRGGEQVFSRPDKQDRDDPARLRSTYLEQVTANREFREIAEFFKTVHYLHIVPQIVRDPERSGTKRNDPYGGDFLSIIADTPKEVRDARIREIERVLEATVPKFSQITVERDERGNPHLKAKYRSWHPPGAWQNERQFSDGTLRLIGLLWALLDGDGPLLIEEPELSLHSEIVVNLPQVFATIARYRGRQIIVSTHSRELLEDSGIDLGEILLLSPGERGTVVEPASSLENAMTLLRGGSNPAEIVMPYTRPDHPGNIVSFGE